MLLCYAMLCYAVLCCAMLCYSILCCAMLCCPAPRRPAERSGPGRALRRHLLAHPAPRPAGAGWVGGSALLVAFVRALVVFRITVPTSEETNDRKPGSGRGTERPQLGEATRLGTRTRVAVATPAGPAAGRQGLALAWGRDVRWQRKGGSALGLG